MIRRFVFKLTLFRRCVRICSVLPTTSTINKYSTIVTAMRSESKDDIFSHGMFLLKVNGLNRFRDEIPCIAHCGKVDRTKDNYFWMLVKEYYARNVVDVKDVERIFRLYLSLFSARLDIDYRVVVEDHQDEETERQSPWVKLHFPQRTTFHLLNAAYDDYRRHLVAREKPLLDYEVGERHHRQKSVRRPNDQAELEDDDAVLFLVDSPNRRPHIYEAILNAVQQYETKRRRALFHGAVLLANDQSVEFLDDYKINGRTISVEDVEFFCKLSQNVKEPRILLPLIDWEEFLPRNDKMIAEIYEVLALLYGKRRDVDALTRITERMLATRRRLYLYRYALHRIRHFYRCANVAAPQLLISTIGRIDPSVRS